jgi:hypothetical protein
MRSWFYSKDGQQQGPVDEPALRHMLATGEIPPDSLVWTRELGRWRPASEVEDLRPAGAPPPIPTGELDSDEFLPSGPQIRPWVRYFARGIDYLAFGAFIGVVLVFAYPPALEWPNFVFGFLILIVYLVVEPVLLTLFGTTPGKWLLRVRLRRADGARLSYPEALKRSLWVWVVGQACGVPVVQLFTNIRCYSQLTQHHTTSWDRDGGFVVAHQNPTAMRILAAMLFLVVLGILSVIGNLPE